MGRGDTKKSEKVKDTDIKTEKINKVMERQLNLDHDKGKI